MNGFHECHWWDILFSRQKFDYTLLLDIGGYQEFISTPFSASQDLYDFRRIQNRVANDVGSLEETEPLASISLIILPDCM